MEGGGREEEKQHFLLLSHPAPCPVPSEMTKRDVPGFAIGGLSGGESKDQFWRMVALSTSRLPKDKPRYLMGVGYVQKQGDCHACGEQIPGDPLFSLLPPSNTAYQGKGYSPAWEGAKEDMALHWVWF